MSRFDWAALMRAGMSDLRLTPDRFWSLTPVELRLMLGRGEHTAPLRREGLEALMAAWPDVTPEAEQGDRDAGSGRV